METTFTPYLKAVDLMDEQKRRRVLSRRIALALSICCANPVAFAGDEPDRGSETQQSDSLRDLLSHGWGGSLPLPPTEPVGDVARAETSVKSIEGPSAPRRVSPNSIAAGREESLPRLSKTSRAPSLAQILREEGHKLEAGAKPSETSEVPAADIPAPSVLGESILRAAEPDRIAEDDPEPVMDREQTIAEYLRALPSSESPAGREAAAPSILTKGTPVARYQFESPHRVEVPTRVRAKSSDDSPVALVRPAREITEVAVNSQPTSQDQASNSENNPEPKSQVKPETTPPPRIAQIAPRIVKAPEQVPPKGDAASQDAAAKRSSIANLPQLPQPAESSSSKLETAGEQAVESVGTSSKTQPKPERVASSTPASTKPIAAIDDAPAIKNAPASTLATPVRPESQIVGSEADPPALAAAPAKVTPVPAATAIDSLKPGPAEQGAIASLPAPSLRSIGLPIGQMLETSGTVTLHTARLKELAQRSLVKSQQSLKRGATHTARKHSMEAMDAIVSMRDAQEGGNVHGQELKQAFDAIRESKDFRSEFGAVDTGVIERMVAAHVTPVLKSKELNAITGLEAAESYLNFATEKLASAAGGVLEASQSLIMLGQIEYLVGDKADSHAMTVALAIQKASVESDPQYAIGYRVLGSTLMDLGMIDPAANCLIASLQLQPSRPAYTRLQELSRRVGDAETARICAKALEDPRMGSGTPVRLMNPEDFAESHRPSLAQQAPKTAEPIRSSSAKQRPSAKATWVGFKSLFPFKRR